MTFFDNDSSNKKPVGGLSLFNKFKQFDEENSNHGEGPWTKIWDARKGFPFSMKPGAETKVVLLDDIKMFVAAPLLVTWLVERGFPKIDYVRSPVMGDDGEPTGEPCILTEVTGMTPKGVAVAPVMDLTPYTTRDGEEVTHSFKLVMIKDQTVIGQLVNASAHYERSLAGAMFKVSRSMDPKSPNTGNIWFLEQFIEPDALDKKVPEWREEVAKRDIDKGYPVPDHDTAMSLLRQHVAVAEKHKDKKSGVVNYNKERWAELTGKAAPTASDQLASDLEAEQQQKSAATTPTAEFKGSSDVQIDGLSELDDALGL